MLNSRIQENLGLGASFSDFLNKEKDFVLYFTRSDELVYCSDVPGLRTDVENSTQCGDWRRFMEY